MKQKGSDKTRAPNPGSDFCLSFQARETKKSFPIAIIQGNLATLIPYILRGPPPEIIPSTYAMANGGKFAPCSRKFGARFEAENGPKLTSSRFSLSKDKRTRAAAPSFLRSFLRSCGGGEGVWFRNEIRATKRSETTARGSNLVLGQRHHKVEEKYWGATLNFFKTISWAKYFFGVFSKAIFIS